MLTIEFKAGEEKSLACLTAVRLRPAPAMTAGTEDARGTPVGMTEIGGR